MMDKNAKFIVTANNMTAVLPLNTINEIFGVVRQ
jgi:hypothetical protein